MSYKYLATLGCLFTFSLAATQTSLAKDPKRSFEKSVFMNFKTLPANRAAMDKSVKNVQAKFNGWAVTTDKLSGYFTDIYGAPITLSGNTNPDKAQNCMQQQLSTLGVNKTEWKQVSNYSAPKADYVNYKQSINGHVVVFSSLSFRFTKDGDLARIQMKNYGRPDAANLRPVLSEKEAQNVATKDLTDVNIQTQQIDQEWSWFPVPAANGYSLHPAWHFKITGRIPGSIPLKLTGYIDAINGDLLYRTNEVKETAYDLTVKGVVYKNGTLNPATPEPLQDLGLNIGSSTFFTDTGGSYSTSLLSLPILTDVPLAGLWSTVIDSVTGLMPDFNDLVSLPGTTFTYPTTTPSSDRHINAYYHVTRVHNFMKGYFPSFTGMDFSLPTNVDLTSGTCNAFYSGTDINFFAADAACHSFSELGDVIYHEYGHGITDHFYTEITGSTIMNGALNEASSDIWALSITHSPILAANAYVGYGGFIRRYDMTPQVYPIDLQGFDPHKDGQIIAGTWWDLGINLGSVDSMTKLFTDVYYDVPDGPSGTEGSVYQSMLIDVLMADDNNSNLMDGTPHYNQIVAAFAKHGIYLEGDAYLTHDELPIQPAGGPIPVTALLTVGSTTYFHDLTMYYQVNGAGPWTSVVLTNSGFHFSGTIPAQPAGATVSYYFIVHDELNTPNAFFPITCNPALPLSETTIPFQFGVGIYTKDSANFETAPAGWRIGSNPGDNASAGLWRRAAPVPSSFFTSWPIGDHTTGSGDCAITGSGSSGFSGVSVSDGSSSVATPVFDISSFSSPVISYYRWFSNEQDLTNFKKDPWIVKIRDASNTTWKTVENTYQADLSWRHRIFAVSQYLPASTTQIQVKFFASDSIYTNWAANGQGITVGGLDDFYIYDNKNTTGVAAVPSAKAEIFPNPADQQVQIILSEKSNGTISVYDMTGKKVSDLKMDLNSDRYSLNTKGLAAGNYNLVIQTPGSIQSKLIAILHP